jgi:hypothetical protein
MGETEPYFDGRTYDKLRRINLDPEGQFPLMPRNVIKIIVDYNFGIYYNLNLCV